MRKLLLAVTLSSAAVAMADTVYIDNSMAAATRSDTEKYEERVSVGPYVEFMNVKADNVNYSYKVNNRRYDITVDNTNLYGALRGPRPQRRLQGPGSPGNRI